MSKYFGRDVDNISNVEKLDNITFSGTTTYALTKSSVAFTPSGANNILISIDGVVQMGNFSTSTSNIVFDWSPTSANTCDWILHYGTGLITTPADGTVTLAKMASNSVDSNQYVDGSIDAVHLSANSVDSDAYVDGSIDAVHMSANSIDSDSYVDASIDNAHLADDAVGVAELSATGTASSSTFLRGDNSWATAGGGLVKIFDTNTTAAATITETDCFTSTYQNYLLIFTNINFASDDQLRARMINSSDAEDSAGICITTNGRVGGGIYSAESTSRGGIDLGGYADDIDSAAATTQGCTGYAYIMNPEISASAYYFVTSSGYRNSGNTNFNSEKSWITSNDNFAGVSIKFYGGNGTNFTTNGNLTLYGMTT